MYDNIYVSSWLEEVSKIHHVSSCITGSILNCLRTTKNPIKAARDVSALLKLKDNSASTQHLTHDLAGDF